MTEQDLMILKQRLERWRKENKQSNKSEDDIIDAYAYSTLTNGIYVCMGGYAKTTRMGRCGNNNYVELIPDKSKILYIDDENIQFYIYRNIEDPDCQRIVHKDLIQNFESKNIILFPPNYKREEFYKKVRLLFLKTCLESTQEEAVKKVLKYKGAKND